MQENNVSLEMFLARVVHKKCQQMARASYVAVFLKKSKFFEAWHFVRFTRVSEMCALGKNCDTTAA
jgi:hypothetical protein